MKVVHLLKTTAGAAWAVKLLKLQVLLGVEVHVVLPDKLGKAAYYQKNGCHVHYLNVDFSVKKPWENIKTITSLRKLIKKISPEIVHSHFVGTTLIMRLALMGMNVPRIFQVPGPLHLEHSLFRMLEMVLSGKTDHWIGSCQWTVDKYISMGIKPDKVHLSYYGTDIDNFVSNTPVDLYTELALDKKSIVIGMVAYMYPPKTYLGQTRGLKGHEDLIDAVAIVKKNHPKVHLIFVGGAWNNAVRYESEVIKYGKTRLGSSVTFLGNRTDVLDLYPSLDIAVFPSHSENVGGAVESLLMNVPTITSNVGGFPDLIKDQQTGLLVPAKEPDKLAASITNYIENKTEAHRQCKNGNQLARELFDINVTAKETVNIYQKILN
jgi:glycosyltransferase involved in cell wall biosynthesis